MSVPAAGVLRVQICGPLAIERGERLLREADLPGRQGRRLWAYLVLNQRRPIARDELATALWGDEIPDTWDDGLNALASRLRAALRPFPGVVVRGEVGRYALELPGDVFIDFERGWRALLRADVALRERDLVTASTEALIARSIASRGFMPGEAGPWIEARRRVLADTLLQATELSAEAELARGSTSDAERLARELITLDALRESGYRILMRALAAEGNGAQALRVMEECRATLRAELGGAPSAETERVFREAAGLATLHH